MKRSKKQMKPSEPRNRLVLNTVWMFLTLMLLTALMALALKGMLTGSVLPSLDRSEIRAIK